MTTDPREYQNYDYKNFPSKKWPQRKKAIAISMATCLSLGAIGYEIVREKEVVLEVPNAQTQIFPQPVHYDADLIIRYNESLAKIKELKKLLFLQKNPPPPSRIAELTKQLEDRETLLKELSDSLAAEKEKTHILDLALANLTYLIELQRSSNQAIVQNLHLETEHLIATHLAEEDLLTINFEKHLSQKEAEALALQQKFEKEKAALLATFEEQLSKEKQAAEELAKTLEVHKENLRLASDNEKEEFLAAIEQKLIEKEEIIKKLDAHQEGLEEFFALKEQALQATESAWKDYALDLSQELQNIEKTLADKIETQQQLELEIAAVTQQLAKAEKKTLSHEAFSKAATQDFEKLAERYNLLEEAHSIHRLLSAYQHEEAAQSYATTLQDLTKQIEALKEEIFVINEALEREIKVGEALLSEKTNYLALTQQLQDKVELADAYLNELENQLGLLTTQLGQKSLELEELGHIANIQLALASHHAGEELAQKKAEHDTSLQQNAALLQREKVEKELLEKDLSSLQESYELLTAQLEKSGFEILGLKTEKEGLEKRLEEQALAFSTYQKKYLEEFEINLLATQHLTSQLQAALIANEELQTALQSHETTSSKELLAQKSLIEQLEAQLADNLAKKEDLTEQLAQTTIISKQELNEQQLLVKDLEEQLKISLAKNEELHQQANLAKESYEQQFSIQQQIVKQLEDQLKENLAKKEDLQHSFDQSHAVLTDELSKHEAAIIDLEALLKNSYTKQDELQRQLEDDGASFNLIKQEFLTKIEENKALVAQLETQLQEAHQKTDESYLIAQEEKQQLLDQINEQQSLAQQLENQLNSVRADYEQIQQHLSINQEKSQTQITEQNLLIVQLEDQVAELKTHLTSNQSHYQNSIAKLEKELEENKQSLEQIEEKYAIAQRDYETTLAHLKDTTESHDAERSRLLQDSEAYRMAALDLGSKLEETLASNQTLSQLLKAEEQSNEKAQKELEEKLSLLVMESQEEQAKISHLEEAVKMAQDIYKTHLTTSKAEIDKLSQELAQMTAKAEEADRYLLTYQSTIEDAQTLYKSRVEDLKAQNEALAKELATAQSERMKYQESFAVERNAFEQQIVKLQEDFGSLNVAKHLLQEQLEIQFLTAQELHQKVSSKENLLAQRDEMVANHQEEIKVLKEQLDHSLTLKADLERNVQYIQQLSDVLSQKEQEFREAITKIQTLQEEIVQKNTSYDALNLLFVEQQKVAEELKQSLEKEVEKNNKMASEMSALQTHIKEKEQLLIEVTESKDILKESKAEEKISALE